MNRLPVRFLILSLALVLTAGQAAGQAALNKADRLARKMIYIEAAEAYAKAYDKRPSNAAAIGAGESYRALADFARSEAWYRRANWNDTTIAARNRFNFAQVLKSNGRYDEAKVMFVEWGDQVGDHQKGEFWANTCNFALDLQQQSQGYQIRTLSFSSPYSEIAPVFYRKGIVYASNRPRGETLGRKDARNAQAFYDLWYAERQPNGVFEKPVFMKGKINTGLNDGPISFSKADHIAYITRSNNTGLARRSKTDRVRKLQLFRTQKINEKWRNIEPFVYNNREYTFAHASLSPDEKTLYFTSDMPGGYGGTDLWRVVKQGDSWSKPENLGPELNTQGNEAFAFVMDGGLLYFASDGHPGLGGFDLFSARVKNGKGTQIENLGIPINSPADDFGLVWEADAPTGYFTSNRLGGRGQDDIYFFTRSQKMEVYVLEKGSKLALPGVEVEVEDYDGKTSRYTTDNTGKFQHYIKTGRQYRITLRKSDYITAQYKVSTEGLNPSLDIQKRLSLEKESRYTVSGFIIDSLTQKPMSNVTVRLVDMGETLLKTNKLGRFVHEIEPEKEYVMQVSEPGYVPRSFFFSTKGMTQPTALNYNISLLPGDSWVYIEGRIRSESTQKPLSDVNIRVVEDYSGKEVTRVRTNTNGDFFITLSPNQTYSIIASRYGYFANRYDHEVREGKLRDSIQVDIDLYDRQIGKVVNTLYYDFDAASLRAFDRRELIECAYFLMDNPDVSVDLGAHTDIRGSAAYNQLLSLRRARSAVDFIRTRKIKPSRIIANGYGESRPAIDCIKLERACTEADHQLNRRAELKVIEMATDQ